MNSIDTLLSDIGFESYDSCNTYSPIGKNFCIHTDEMDGTYWYYETDSFIIDIHNYIFKKDYIMDNSIPIPSDIAFISTYFKSANGEWFTPYQSLTSNSVFSMAVQNTNIRYLFHANFPLCCIGVKFKSAMTKEYITSNLNIKEQDISNVFLEVNERITTPIAKLANAILTCTMDSPAAELFFEAKAKEWLSITLDEYIKSQTLIPISKQDDIAIENVADYINDHYTSDIPQELLEKIAMMSGTKLKNLFKRKYHMSITEFTQRKRMNIAETLLLTTQLEIKDIAKSVGYHSHSRFSTLFKKYKGIYPREVKKLY